MVAGESGKPVSVIVGLGVTGLACARFLHSEGHAFKVVDNREQPPCLEELTSQFPGVEIELGPFSEATLSQAAKLVVSPGVSLNTPAIVSARRAGVQITGDIDLFSQKVDKPVIAITGSNGKSTVVALVAAILEEAGYCVALGGNLDASHGRPALDLLTQSGVDFYVLELSSFQLETTTRLNAEVATILNLSEDHMDRYDTLEAYHRAKLNIFNGCRQIVVNRDSPYSQPARLQGQTVWEYGFGRPGPNGVGFIEESGGQYIVYRLERVMSARDLKIAGRHNIANAMASLTLALAVGVDLGAIRRGLTRFPGLPHRCQWVCKVKDVDFYNDSKGTNVGATVAAIEGLGKQINGRVVLIAGGQGKAADFRPLAPALSHWGRAVVLIGEDAKQMANCIGCDVQIRFAESMQDAVPMAQMEAQPGDAVLLSPACASFDMFDNFAHRGRVFTEAAEALQ